jgi:hypothetical protein
MASLAFRLVECRSRAASPLLRAWLIQRIQGLFDREVYGDHGSDNRSRSAAPLRYARSAQKGEGEGKGKMRNDTLMRTQSDKQRWSPHTNARLLLAGQLVRTSRDAYRLAPKSSRVERSLQVRCI